MTRNKSLDFTQRIEKKLAEYNASQNVFKRWFFELLCWLISAVFMCAIVGTYIWIKDKPAAEVDASLLMYANSYGKIASAALIVPTSEALGQLKWNWFNKSKAMWDFEIFDKASRGPWGAVVLLFRTKARSLAALGALLILLLLAIDTFFQQVVEMQTRWTLLDVENASGMLLLSTVPRVTRYSPRVSMEYRDGVELLQTNEELLTVANSFFYDNGTQPTRFGNGTRATSP
jgi:hypothetical protein